MASACTSPTLCALVGCSCAPSDRHVVTEHDALGEAISPPTARAANDVGLPVREQHAAVVVVARDRVEDLVQTQQGASGREATAGDAWVSTDGVVAHPPSVSQASAPVKSSAAPAGVRERMIAFFAANPPDVLLRGIRAERARRSLAEFFVQAFPEIEPSGVELEHGWHITAICDHVQWQLECRARALADPEYTIPCLDLLVNVPPRTMKTLIIQVAAVAWAWLHWPELRIMCLSINPTVAKHASDLCRQLIRSAWYQDTFKPEWQIREDKDGVTSFGNTAGGHRDVRGWTANVVGEGADWRIVDDPNDPKKAHSAVERGSVNDRWRYTLANRKNSPRLTITTGIQQRVHEDDWSAHRIVESWVRLILPMEFEVTHPYAGPTPMPVANDNRLDREAVAGKHAAMHTWKDPRKVEGEILHPRFTREFLDKTKIELGSYGYAGQMQQRPSPSEGGLFKRAHWRFFRIDGEQPGAYPRPAGCADPELHPTTTISLSELDWIAISCDATFGKTAQADNVGLLVIGGKRANRYVLHDSTRKMTISENKAAIIGLRATYPRAKTILIELKANGQAVIDELTGYIDGMIGVNPEGGKESRANASQPSVESGNWYLLDGAPWLDAFVEEFANFPNGRNDDRVDAWSQCAIHFGHDPLVGQVLGLYGSFGKLGSG